MQGDTIIEYDGVRDLTTEKFIALTARTRKSKAKHRVVFVRGGYEYSVRVSSGFTGVSCNGYQPTWSIQEAADQARCRTERGYR